MKLFSGFTSHCLPSSQWAASILYSPCIGIKYFGFINLNNSFSSSCLACPLVWTFNSLALVYTFAPFKYNLLIILLIDIAFPGIGDDENITVSSGIRVIFLSLPLAILDKAASGSPCDPVHNKHTLDGSILLASSLVMNISLSLIYPHSKAISILLFILLPNTATFLLYCLHVWTICVSL